MDEKYYSVFCDGKEVNCGLTAKEVRRCVISHVEDNRGPDTDLSYDRVDGYVTDYPKEVVGTWVVTGEAIREVSGNIYGDPTDCYPDDEETVEEFEVTFEVVEDVEED